MFPLAKRVVGGFSFRQIYPKSFGVLAGHKHLGVDYRAMVGDKLYAPFNGTVKTLWGSQGGNTIWFYPEGQDVIIRFMHLNSAEVNNGSKVKEGDLIARTGNTGSATNAPHLHCDISKHNVDIYNINNFIDPEQFSWFPDKKIKPVAKEILSNVSQPVMQPDGVVTTPEPLQPQGNVSSTANVQISYQNDSQSTLNPNPSTYTTTDNLVPQASIPDQIDVSEIRKVIADNHEINGFNVWMIEIKDLIEKIKYLISKLK